MNAMIHDFCIDLASLQGSLAQRVAAAEAAGFSGVVASAEVLSPLLNEHMSLGKLRLAALHARLDYEGLDGQVHAHKLEMAKSLLQLCKMLDCPLLVLDATALAQSSGAFARIVADLRKLSLLAVPLGLKIALRAHSGARHVRDFMKAADVVQAAERVNLGLALDVREWLCPDADLEQLEGIDPQSVFQVQLADALATDLPEGEWQAEERYFPGEGVHGASLHALVVRFGGIGFAGHYAFADVRGDCALLPNADVAGRAARSAENLALNVLRRGQPLAERRRRLPGTCS